MNFTLPVEDLEEINISDINISDISIILPSENITDIEIDETEIIIESPDEEPLVLDEGEENESNEEIVEIEIELEIIGEEPKGEGSGIGDIAEIDEEILDEIQEELDEVDLTEEVEVVEEPQEITIVGGVIRKLTGFVIRGFKGMTGNVIDGEKKISVYIQRDFSRANVSVGDIINLDPVLIRVSGAGTAVDGQTVYQCGTITEAGSYVMNQSIVASGDCLTIGANSVNLDMNGFNISGSGANSGVLIDQYNHTVIQNGSISGFNGFVGYGMFLSNDYNSTIFNVSLISNSRGIYLNYSVKANFTNFRVLSSSFEGISLINCSNSIFNNVSSFNNMYGLIILSGMNNIFNNINCSTNTINGIIEAQEGLAFFSVSFSEPPQNNSFYNIFVDLTESPFIEARIGFYGGGENGRYGNMTIFSNNYTGLEFSNVNNNSFVNLKLYNNNYYGLRFHGDNNIFRDCNFSNHTRDVAVSDGGAMSSVPSLNNSFINCSYNTEWVNDLSILTRKWYYQGYINDSDNNPIENAVIQFYNVSNDLVLNLTSNSLGFTPMSEIIDYINANGTRYYYSNYTIFAFNNGFLGNISLNFTSLENELDSVITIYSDNIVPVSYQINSTPLIYSSLVSWNTSEPTNYTINYENNLDLSNSISSSEYLLKSSETLLNLLPNTTYYYQISFCDLSSNCNLSQIYNFTTISVESQFEVYKCGTLSQSNQVYTQQIDIVQNLNSDCISVSGHNITFDCNYKFINSSKSYSGVVASGSNITIKNCNINMGGGAIDGGEGILLYNAHNSFVYDSILNGQGNGLKMEYSYNNVVDNLTANSNDFAGISMDSGGNNNFSNLSIADNAAAGIYFADSLNNRIESSNIVSNSIIGLLLDIGADNTSILNSNFSNPAVFAWDVYVSSLNNTFLNCSYLITKEKVNSGVYSKGELIRKWYYQAYVTDNSSTFVPNASVQAYNVSGDLTLNLTTNESGWTSVANIIDYVNSAGTRDYYSSYILAANDNETLWDSHNYNVTLQQNNFNDSFIVDIDVTPPVLSGVSWSLSSPGTADNNVVAVINWNSDEGSNSSVTYWASPAQTIFDDGRVIAHSITVAGMQNNTLYNFNYTSCDFAGNCNVSITYSFTTPSPGQDTSGSSGGGIFCLPNIKCGLCIGNPGEQGIRSCSDDNNCGGEDYTENCIVPLVVGEGEQGLGGGLDSQETPFKDGTKCISDYQCSEWEKCNAVYNLDEIIQNKVLLEGEQKRICVDKAKCEYDRIERRGCSTQLPIIAEKVEECFEDYIKIYDSNDVLIARMRLSEEVFDKLDIQMIFDDNAYCPYCFDAIKNFDEDDIDCVDEGDSCASCSLEVSSVRGEYGFIILIGLIIICVLIVLGFGLWKNKD